MPALKSGCREAISVFNSKDELVGYMSFDKSQNHVEEFAFAGEIEHEVFKAFANSISQSIEILISGYDKKSYERLKKYATEITKEKEEPTLFRIIKPERMRDIARKPGLDKKTLFAPYLT